jgi:hypothetical protein
VRRDHLAGRGIVVVPDLGGARHHHADPLAEAAERPDLVVDHRAGLDQRRAGGERGKAAGAQQHQDVGALVGIDQRLQPRAHLALIHQHLAAVAQARDDHRRAGRRPQAQNLGGRQVVEHAGLDHLDRPADLLDHLGHHVGAWRLAGREKGDAFLRHDPPLAPTTPVAITRAWNLASCNGQRPLLPQAPF